MIKLALLIIVLHSVEGIEIDVNPKEITSMRAGKAGEGGHLTEGVRCLVNLSDGKFVSVVETCERIRSLIKEMEKPNG